MLVFNHVGLVTNEKKQDEFYYAPNKVWITDSEKHPYKIEWLRYEEDTPVKNQVRTQPHVGYVVDSLENASKGLQLLLGPMVIDESKTVGFYACADGAVIELMEIK